MYLTANKDQDIYVFNSQYQDFLPRPKALNTKSSQYQNLPIRDVFLSAIRSIIS